MKSYKKSFIFLVVIAIGFLILHLPILNQNYIVDKKFGTEENYTIHSYNLQTNIPILAQNTVGNEKLAYQLNWDLDTNSFVQEKSFPFYCTELRCFYNLKWDGETIGFPAAFAEDVQFTKSTENYRENRALEGDLRVSIAKIEGENYRIMTDANEYNIYLPDMYHALAGVETTHKIFILYLAEENEKLQIQYNLKVLEISAETGDTQTKMIKNIPSGYTEFLQQHIEFFLTETDSVVSSDNIYCIWVNNGLFLHDDKSVYKITLENCECKRIFSVVTSIPQNIKEQYSDIEHTTISAIGYYQGLFCLELLAETGVGNDYFYIPFIESPIVYCRGSENVNTVYLLPNDCSTSHK